MDRDGVINRPIIKAGKPYSPQTLSEFKFLPGVKDACNRLQQAGYLTIIVTNQPEISRGKLDWEIVKSMNQLLYDELPINDIRVCNHDDAHYCSCRKPKPGLLLEAAKDWSIDLTASFLVGDRWKDIEAGRRSGCKTIFIDYDYDEMKPKYVDYTADSLKDAVEWIFQQHQE